MVLRSIHIVYIFHAFSPFYYWVVFHNISLILFVHLFFTLDFFSSFCLLWIICYEPDRAWKHPVAANQVLDEVETPYYASQTLSTLAFLTSSLVLPLTVLFSSSLFSSHLLFSAPKFLCCFHVGPFIWSPLPLEPYCWLPGTFCSGSSTYYRVTIGKFPHLCGPLSLTLCQSPGIIIIPFSRGCYED